MKILVTGSAGFIGFHLCQKLLASKFSVFGIDNFSNYYDVTLKEARNEILKSYKNFEMQRISIENEEGFLDCVLKNDPDIIIHLAAQAGVRYSLEKPRAYIDTNIIGTFNVMEAARISGVKHLLMASTSSVYGGNRNMPFKEDQKTDTQMTIYAATKKANENMAHAYSHLWNIPTTMFRFFTVYGPWGRPDLALYKFVDSILNDRPIDVYNNGEMYRDFTYIDDLVESIRLLIECIPPVPEENSSIEGDNLSNIAPYRVVNIGNSSKIRLLDFIDAIEVSLKKKSTRNYKEIQIGDVPATWANADLLYSLTGFRPSTPIQVGVDAFVDWFREYYKR